MREHQKLSQIYHNLEANSEDQKFALQVDQIILSPWELLCFTLFKALATSSLTSDQLALKYFYTETNEFKTDLRGEGANYEFSQIRMDKHRILVILLARLHRKLIL